METDNRNKTVVVTGASRGIGYELAKIFARNSYKLVLISRNYDRLCEVQKEFQREFHTESLVIAKDLSVHNAATDVFDELNAKKITVDILVNNAGIGDFGMFYKEDFDRINRMLMLNIVSLTHLTKLFLDGMIERKDGKILNIASMAAYIPGPYMAVYYASKAYVKSFSEAIAYELKGTGVTVTAVCPGLTKTGFQQEVGSEKSASSKLNLYASSEEVAKFAVKALAEGKEVAVPGFLNLSLLYTNRIIPDRLRPRIIKIMQEINRKT